jgi:hypothetical protein
MTLLINITDDTVNNKIANTDLEFSPNDKKVLKILRLSIYCRNN